MSKIKKIQEEKKNLGLKQIQILNGIVRVHHIQSRAAI